MPDQPNLPASSPSWSAWQQVDAACDAFERAWQSGNPPELAEHLAGASEAMRGELLYCLLRIDLEYRRRQGDSCELSTYLARFAEHADTVRRAFGDDSTRSEFPSPDGKRPSLGAALALPARCGKFELVELLGQGGMGIVYRAVEYHGERPLRQVALKLIRPDLLASLSPERARELVARFQEEARLATQLEHDHIVRVYEVGTLDGQPYFSMQFIAGRNLADLLLEGPLTNARAAELMRGVAEAVAAAHAKGIIHRDLKPRNILLDARQRPYVADFGLARWLEEERELSQTEMPLGTAAYMSPEQATGRSVGKATDIYGLGATLYELLTDRPPFRAATAVETLVLVLNNDPVPPRELNPQIAADLQTICLKCLEKDAAARYSYAAEVADELARYLDDRPIIARPAGAVEVFWRWCRRNPWIAGLSAAVAICLLAGTIISGTLASIAYDNWEESDRRGSALTKSLATEKKLSEDRAAALAEARWQIYRLRLMRMERMWLDRDWGALVRLLKESTPSPEEPDLRGWEWYFLQTQSSRRAWRIPGTDFGESFDWDQQTGQLAMLRSSKVELWRPSERQLARVIPVPAPNAGTGLVRWCPDHRRLAVGGKHPDIHVLDCGDSRIVSTLRGSQLPTNGRLQHIAWSPRGDHVAGIFFFEGRPGDHVHVRVWHVQGEPVEVLAMSAPPLTACIHWNIDQSIFAITDLSGRSSLWNAADWSFIRHTFVGGSTKPSDNESSLPEVIRLWTPVWSPDRRRLAYGGNPAIRIVDMDLAVLAKDKFLVPTAVKTIRQPIGVSAFCWLDNERLIVADDAHQIRIAHVEQESLGEPYRLHDQSISQLVAGPNGLIASAGSQENPTIWSPSEPSPEYANLSTVKHDYLPVWHPRENVLALLVPHKSSWVAATWSADNGKTDLVLSARNPSMVNWSETGNQLAFHEGRWWKAVPWPLSDGVAPSPSEFDVETRHNRHSRDGRFLASVDVDHMPDRIRDRLPQWFLLVSDTQGKIAKLHIDGATEFAWHPQRSLIAVAVNGSIRLVDPQHGSSPIAVTSPDLALAADLRSAWSRDGKHLLAISRGGILCILDGSSLQVKRSLHGHAGDVQAAAWTPDGTRVVSAGADGFVRFWDPTRGDEVLKIPFPRPHPTAELLFSASGHWLAIAPGSKTTPRVFIFGNQPSER